MKCLNVYEWRGQDVDGIPVTFTYCGIDEGLRDIMPFVQTGLIKQNPELYNQYQIEIEDFNNYIFNSTSDLLIIATDKNTADRIDTDDYILMPFRIHQIVKTGRGLEVTRKLMSHREVKRYKQLNGIYGFDYYVTHEDEDFFNFYNTMHKPTMEHRYGALARSVEINTAYETIFKCGLLFLVTQDGSAVSGSVCHLDLAKNWLNARLIGVLNGNVKYRDNGAQNYVYHAIIDWACTVGEVDIVDFQGCEPFLKKGTFQYKKRFATEAILPPNDFCDKRLLVKANFGSMSIRRYFIDNPMMILDHNNNLGAGYFFDSQHEPRLDIPYQCPGFLYQKLIDIDKL